MATVNNPENRSAVNISADFLSNAVMMCDNPGNNFCIRWWVYQGIYYEPQRLRFDNSSANQV